MLRVREIDHEDSITLEEQDTVWRDAVEWKPQIPDRAHDALQIATNSQVQPSFMGSVAFISILLLVSSANQNSSFV